MMNGKKTRLRNLRQYKSMDDEEFEDAYEELLLSKERDTNFEQRIQNKLEEFEIDYDISDMKFNDKEVLRSMIQAIISLEELEQLAYRIGLSAADDETALSRLEKVSRMKSFIRSDISNMQNDLNITRKIRKGEKEESVLAAIDNLHKKAKEFVNAKFGRIYCPKCKMLIGSVWVLYPKSNNKFWFHCERILEDGSICDTRVVISYADLIKNGMKNIDGVPDF